MFDVRNNTNTSLSEEANATDIPRHQSISDELMRLIFVVGTISAVICLIGIIFNILNLFVLIQLVRRRRGVSPTYHLLIAMGVADMLTLTFAGVFLFTSYVRSPPLPYTALTDEHSDFYHVLHRTWFYPTNICSLSSNWLVVATTVFRFLAVAFPMKVCQWCTLFRMRISILLIFALAIVMNVPDWLTNRFYINEDGRIRGESTDLYDSIPAFYQVYAIVEIYIPFLVNFGLVMCLIKNLHATRHSMSDCMQDGKAIAREKEHRKISIMLIAIVIWFLLCNLPYIVYQIMRDYSQKSRSDIESEISFLKFGIIKDIGPYLSHTCNIILYCLCNNTYRRTFVATLMCKKTDSFRNFSQRTYTTQMSTRYDSRIHRDSVVTENKPKTNNRNGKAITNTEESVPFKSSEYVNGRKVSTIDVDEANTMNNNTLTPLLPQRRDSGDVAF